MDVLNSLVLMCSMSLGFEGVYNTTPEKQIAKHDLRVWSQNIKIVPGVMPMPFFRQPVQIPVLILPPFPELILTPDLKIERKP
jgi:hypothetical protein